MPSRLVVGGTYVFKNDFVLEKHKRGQYTLKFNTSMVVFHHRRVPSSDGFRHSWGPWEYLFFRGAEEPVRFRKLKDALDHAADIVAARDAAKRLGAGNEP